MCGNHAQGKVQRWETNNTSYSWHVSAVDKHVQTMPRVLISFDKFDHKIQLVRLSSGQPPTHYTGLYKSDFTTMYRLSRRCKSSGVCTLSRFVIRKLAACVIKCSSYLLIYNHLGTEAVSEHKIKLADKENTSSAARGSTVYTGLAI